MKRNIFNRPANGTDGITLIEMMVGMAMSIVIMLALTMAIQTESRSSSREVNRVDMIHNLQNAAQHLKKDLRLAGYDKDKTSAMNVNAITDAQANTITFVYDDDGDPATPQASFTYRMDAAGDTGYNANHLRLVRVKNGGGVFPVASDIVGVAFTYRDVNDALFVPVSQADRDNIRAIVVAIQGQSASVDVDRGAKLTDALGFRVKPRNFP